MAGVLTRINNNQVTDAVAGNIYLGVNAAAKVQEYSITSGLLANNLVYGSDLTVTGNLTINGNTTTVDTYNLVVEDPLILLAKGQTGAPTLDIGFIGKRGTDTNIAFVWDEANDQFVTAYTSSETTNTTITISSYADLRTGNLTVGGTTSLLGNVATITVTGNVVGGNLLTTGLISAAGNVTGGNFTTTGLITATGNVTGGNLTTSGNVQGGNILTTGVVSATGNGTFGNISTAGTFNAASLSVSGNIDAGNLRTSGTITASGNVISGNVTTAGLITATGNIQGGNLLTTGLISSTGSITSANGITATANITGGNVTTAGLITATGNIQGGNLLTTGLISATGTITSAANITGANILTGGLISATGSITSANGITATANITGGNITTAGLITATGNIQGGNITTIGLVTATGNVTGGNITTVGEVSAAGNIIGGNISTAGMVYVTNTTNSSQANNTGALQVSGGASFSKDVWVAGNVYAGNIVATVANTLSVQDPLLYLTANTPYPYNYDIGFYSQFALTGNPPGNGYQHTGWVRKYTDNVWYLFSNVSTEPTAVVTFDANTVYDTMQSGSHIIVGYVSASGNVIGGNITTAGLITATGNITGGNLNGVNLSLSGNVVSSLNVTGNIAGGNLVTAGLITATGNVIGGNVTTAGLITATGNIQGGNLLTAGLITATGSITSANGITATANITGGNLLTTGLISATGNITSGNVNTNIVSATGNINGANVNVGTGNITGGNVSVTGNIYGANFIGNISGNIDAAGSNTWVQFNDTDDILGASANFTFNKGTNTMTVNGTIQGTTVSATANVVSGNVTTGGLITATGNVIGGNLVTGGLITATGNVIGGNVNTAGLVLATGNVQGSIILGPQAVFGTSLIPQACSTVTINATDSLLMPVGNTLQRPNSTAVGMLRFNTSGDSLEVYTSTGWEDVGIPAFTVITDQQFAGTGACTTYTLSANSTTAATIVSINGIVQIPTTAYAVTGNSLVFTEAPAVSDTIDVRALTTTTTVTNIENISGNAHVATLDSSSAVEILGNLLPAANVTYDLGSPTLRWRDGWFSGTSLHLGNVTIKNVPGGNTIGFYGPDGITPATIAATSVDTTQIANGTTNMQVVSSGGNITATVGGSANILVAATTGVYVTGIISASGNITGGYIFGNGSQLTGIDATSIQNGTSNVKVLSSGGNVSIGVGGTPNIAVWATTGQYVTGVISATGNITGSNLSVGTGTINVGNVVNTNGNGVGNIGSASVYFNTIFAKATSSQYADLAEMYEADAIIEPGTVVCFGGVKEITQCNDEKSKRIAGVVSTNPSYIMNAGLAGEHVTAVALTGRVPTKVTGSIRKGDMLVSAGNGRARAEADPAVGTVIGKALADFDGAEGVIEVVIGRL